MYKKLLNSLYGGVIFDVNRVCNLISIIILTAKSEKIHLHVQSFLRITKGDKVILSSEDIYRCGKKCNQAEFEWDVPGQSVFDESLDENKADICNSVISKVEQEENGDLMICMKNNICLQILIDTTEKEEKYRLFNFAEEIVVES